MDMENNTQTFFKQHIDDITALDVHPDQQTVATGEIGPKPSIYLWDSDTKQELHVFKGKLEKGICNLSFSADGMYMGASAIDVENHIGVFKTDINNKQFECLGTFKSGGSYIIDFKMLNETQFVTVGKRFYKFWEQKSKGVFKGSLGSGMKPDQSKRILMCAVQNKDGRILVGNTGGSLFVF